jgi:catechol 2,3-dioxygenase-like lactoylglutathione lyase family enzyme
MIARLLRYANSAMVLMALCTTLLQAQDKPQRPVIVGIAHVAFSAHDLDKSRQFYSGFLGFEEQSQWKDPDGSTAFTFFKINDHQFVELTPEKQAGTDRFGDVSFETNNAEAMRLYLASKGVKVPDAASKGRIGNLSIKIADPAGHSIEFVQYAAGGQTSLNYGEHLGPHRVSMHMTHAGLIVTDLDPEYRFFVDVLGFRETWRGSSDGKVLSWINLKSPDSSDYVEFMLYKVAPAPDKRGSAHHICLVVPSVDATVAKLKTSPYMQGYGREIDQHLGKNRKRQANLFDPDGTRVEIMEPGTIDGVPTPPSTAPPPQ